MQGTLTSVYSYFSLMYRVGLNPTPRPSEKDPAQPRTDLNIILCPGEDSYRHSTQHFYKE